jgi:hypothetical protein
LNFPFNYNPAIVYAPIEMHEMSFWKRERLLNLVRKMQAISLALIIAGDYAGMQPARDEQNWRELDETAGELDTRLQVLDVAVYAGSHNTNWYRGLREYVAAILKAIQDEAEHQ